MHEFTSPFTKYLHTNYVPSSIDRTQICQLLKEPELAAAKLDEEICRLQAVLNDIRKQKTYLDEIIHEHYQLLTPFRRLPDDMLREIFLWCLPDKNNAVMSAMEAPLVLGRVCSRWRYLAYQTPRLWATLHIPLPIPPTHGGLSFWIPTETYQQMCTDFEQKFQRHCDAVRDWLNRSRNCPLSISLNPRDSVPISQNHYIRAYLDILLTFSHRWRSLEISIPSGEYSTFLASIEDTAIPWLELLHLKFSRRSAQENVWTNSGLLNAKKLRVLHLAQFPYRLSSLEIDWSRITHLIISDATAISRHKKISLEEAYRVFSRCKNLRHCVMDIIDSPDAVSPTDIIPLPHLESLAILDGAFCLATLIECLDIPSLRDITYHTNFWPSSGRRSPLVLLLHRTNNRVHSLTTDLQFFTVADLVECFELAPFLTHLTNKRSRLGISREQARSRSGLPFVMQMMRAILDILLPNSNNQCLCPKLHTLDLKESLVLTDQDALNFIQQRLDASRTLGFGRLAEVNITFAREMFVDMYAQLQCYVDDGLKLDFTCPPPRKVSPGNFNPLNGLVKRDMGPDLF